MASRLCLFCAAFTVAIRREIIGNVWKIIFEGEWDWVGALGQIANQTAGCLSMWAAGPAAILGMLDA